MPKGILGTAIEWWQRRSQGGQAGAAVVAASNAAVGKTPPG